MRANEVTKMLGGSIAIYVVMAACSAGSVPQSATGDGGGSSSGSMGDGSGSGTVLDVLTDPVTEAQADPNQSGTRLKVNYYAGADGSKQTYGNMHDSMRKEDCYFQTASDGTTRCFPLPTPMSYYSDAACTLGLVLLSNCAGTLKPAYVSGAILPSTYPGPAHLFPLGNATTVATAYQLSVIATAPDAGVCGSAGLVYTCVPVSASTWAATTANATVYAVGAEIPPSAFVQATLQAEP